MFANNQKFQRFYQWYYQPPEKQLDIDYRNVKIWLQFYPICFIAHFLMIFFFYFIGAIEMSIFNIGSSVAWISAIFIHRKGFPILAGYIGSMEVVLHAGASVYFLGWDFGFQYYLFAGGASVFVQQAGKNRIFKYVFFTLYFSIFTLLFYYSQNYRPNASFDPILSTSLNIFNILLTFILLGLMLNFFISLVDRAESALKNEYKKSESLLHNILPIPIAEKLKANPENIADGFENTTILFADIVGFTVLSEKITPQELVTLLNKIFSCFDDLLDKYGLEKIKTIGDAYMVASGIPIARPDHAVAIAELALDMVQSLEDLSNETGYLFKIRIGINSGAAVAGVIGKKKFIYDLWGDSVNTASRMESHGIPGEIQVTQTTYNLLKNEFAFEKRGKVMIKGKGELETYLLKCRKS